MSDAAGIWSGLKRPLVAILRGVRPYEIEGIAEALVGAGIEAIEVPLNSPDPFDSIARLQAAFGDRCLCGAGTVLTVGEVERLAATGARLCVSPNMDAGVIRAARGVGMVSLPGVFTATEALGAVAASATALKFFPASILGPGGMKAIRAVLPPHMQQIAVGGVSDGDFQAYAAAGVRAFGLGSSLYSPGDGPDAVSAKAAGTVAAWDEVFG